MSTSTEPVLDDPNAVVPPSRREYAYGWIAGKLLVRGARLALARGDRHEFDHLRAAVRVGNTGPHSHDTGCLVEEALGDESPAGLGPRNDSTRRHGDGICCDIDMNAGT